MAISFVQSPTPPAFASATSYSTAPNNNTVGNLLVVSVDYVGISDTPTISDTAGNTWVAGPFQPYTVNTQAIWYCLNCKQKTGNVVTVQLNAAAAVGSISLVEYSGVNTLDKTASATGSSTSINSGSTAATTSANELLVGFLSSNGGSMTSVAVGTGGSGTHIRSNTVNATLIADNIVSSTGTYSASATATLGAWAGAILTFEFATFSISGSAGVAGATVSYSGTSSGSVTADGSGNYTINGLVPGAYTITPSLTGYTFSPTNANETIVAGNITGVNFTANPISSSGNTSWLSVVNNNMLRGSRSH